MAYLLIRSDEWRQIIVVDHGDPFNQEYTEYGTFVVWKKSIYLVVALTYLLNTTIVGIIMYKLAMEKVDEFDSTGGQYCGGDEGNEITTK